MGRPAYPAVRYAARQERGRDAGAVFTGLAHLIDVQKHAPEFTGGQLLPFHTNNPHVLGYQRPGLPDTAHELISG